MSPKRKSEDPAEERQTFTPNVGGHTVDGVPEAQASEPERPAVADDEE